MRRRPYSVILFDEIEKAHPDVFNILLQVLDDGRITDAQGRTVSFENAIIIMTSNAGSDRSGGSVGFGKTVSEQDEARAVKALEEIMRPEFLNRIDEIVVFRTLDEGDVERIVELELEGLFARTCRLGYKVKITDGAKRRLAAMGYEPRYGVRSLKRTLLDNVEEPLSTLIIEGRVNEGAKVKILPAKAGVTLKVA